MLKSAQIEESYQDLISMMVCENCPGNDFVNFLEGKFKNIFLKKLLLHIG